MAPSTSSHIAEPATTLHSIFDKRQKVLIVAIISIAATCMFFSSLSGFASNIYFPALPTIAHDLNVSIELVNLSVTAYLIFQGLAPSIWGPISDVKGRRVAYVGTFLVFLGSCIGLALTRNYATLIVLRCLQSTGSASTIAIGSGVIGDITTRENRGGYMAVFQAGLLAPVAIGPIIGGGLAAALGWRSIFWFLTIYCGAFLVFLILLLPETLRHKVGNGSRETVELFARYPLTFYQKTSQMRWDCEPMALTENESKKSVDITQPLRILFSKQASPIIICLAIHYAVWQMSITAMSTLFLEVYNLSETQIGLTFLANGVGSILGTLTTGKVLNMDYKRVKQDYASRTEILETTDRKPSFPIEKARLRLIPLFSLLQAIAILVFGWTIRYHVHISVPIITTFFTGWCAVSAQSLVMTYLVDIFQDRSAAGSAALNLARCLCAAAGTSFVLPLIRAAGAGWALSICVLAQGVALLGALIQWKFAQTWRDQKN